MSTPPVSGRLTASIVVLATLLALPDAARAQEQPSAGSAEAAAPTTPPPAPSQGARELQRIRARSAAIIGDAEMFDDGSYDLSRAQQQALAALDCPRALAIAAMTDEERGRARAGIPDPEDPDLSYEESNYAGAELRDLERYGYDHALTRSLSCPRAVDRARVHLALGSDRGLAFLIEARRAHEPGTAALDALVTPGQRDLLARLQEMDGDFSRARAPSVEMLLQMLTLTIGGPDCTARSPDLHEVRGEDGYLHESHEPVAGFVLIHCLTDYMEFHSSWSLPVVSLIAHVGTEGVRVVDRLRDEAWSSNDSVEGELVRGAHVSGSVIAVEVELGVGGMGDPADVARALLLVCSGTSLRCRRVELGSGESRSRWALEGSRLTLLDPTSFSVQAAVDVERWIARELDIVTDPPRPEPVSYLAPGRASWEYQEITEAEGCRYTVVDARGPLNVRARASAGSAVRGTLPLGAVVRATETGAGWIRIEAPLAGWLHRSGLLRTCIDAVEGRLEDEAAEAGDEQSDP